MTQSSNYIMQIQALQARNVNGSIPAAAQALFHNILWQFAKSNWPDKLVIASKELKYLTAVPAGKFRKNREILKKHGIIRYKNRRGSASPLYKLSQITPQPTENKRDAAFDVHSEPQNFQPTENKRDTKRFLQPTENKRDAAFDVHSEPQNFQPTENKRDTKRFLQPTENKRDTAFDVHSEPQNFQPTENKRDAALSKSEKINCQPYIREDINNNIGIEEREERVREERERKERKKTKAKKRKKEKNSETAEEIFERVRKKYPGTKRGLSTEFKYFQKKRDWREVLPILMPALNNQISLRNEKVQRNKGKNRFDREFIPEWKHFKTWIYNRSWEDEEVSLFDGNSDTEPVNPTPEKFLAMNVGQRFRLRSINGKTFEKSYSNLFEEEGSRNLYQASTVKDSEIIVLLE